MMRTPPLMKLDARRRFHGDRKSLALPGGRVHYRALLVTSMVAAMAVGAAAEEPLARAVLVLAP